VRIGPGDVSRPIHGLVVLEQTLGHVTHGKNLQRLLPEVPGFEVDFAEVPFDVSGWRSRVPGFGNWTVRAGIRGRRAVRGKERPDVMIVHTQVPAVLMGRALTRVPTVVSLDATPKQYDSLGEHYSHEIGPEPLERLKTRLNQRCFDRASHLVTWSAWTKRSLVDDYGIDETKITVIPPGVDAARWTKPRGTSPDITATDGAGEGVVRILFVGGDLDRKGGHHLLEGFAELRERHGAAVELHLVTTSPVDAADGVEVYAAMTPNSRELIDLYHRCDVFCLPTLGDCLPMVLPEAGAAGLALVSTDVGAIGEVVRHGETGLLVPTADVPALVRALDRLVSDDELCSRLAQRAARLIHAEHDAATNAGRLVDVVRSVHAGVRS
jgi:glycosyltransferase involved in cell wall biosynthesis